MVKRLMQWFGGESSSLHEAAYLLAFFTILSQVLGLIRDRFLAHIFGAGETLDLYYAAFRIPDFLFAIVGSLVSISIIVPFLTEEKGNGTRQHFLSSLFSFFLVIIVLISILVFLAMPVLVDYTFPGIAAKSELILYTRVLLLSPILLGISNLFAAVASIYKRFALYAISPILYNAGIIAGIVLLSEKIGILGVIIGVVFGAVLHLGIQIPFLSREKLLPKFVLHFEYKKIFKLMGLSFSRTLALSVRELSLLILFGVASLMAAGSISTLNFAWNLQSVPLSIIGVSYSVALFPTLSRLFSTEKSAFTQKLIIATRHILFWSLPTIALFIVLRAHIVRTLLGSGAFDWSDTRLTAANLAVFVISLFAQSLLLLFIRAFYAAGQTLLPLLANSIGALMTVGFAFYFENMMRETPVFRYFMESLFKINDIQGSHILALPLAFTIGAVVSLGILWIGIEWQNKNFTKSVFGGLLQAFSASVLSGFAAYLSLNALDQFFDLDTFFGVFTHGFLSGIFGIVAGVATFVLFKSPELKEVWITLHRKIFQAKLPIPDQETL